MWWLTYQWASHSHPKKPKKWIARRYFGRFNKFRNDRWVFGDRDHIVNDRGDIPYMVKFSWTNIVRHQLVAGGASPDDPDLADYWANGDGGGQTPAGQLQPAPARQAGRAVSAMRGPPARPRPATTVPT